MGLRLGGIAPCKPRLTRQSRVRMRRPSAAPLTIGWDLLVAADDPATAGERAEETRRTMARHLVRTAEISRDMSDLWLAALNAVVTEMPLDDPARPRSFDPAVDLLGSALHDGAVVLDAYARFATTVINIALFPYAAIAPAKKSSEPAATGAPARRRIAAWCKSQLPFLSTLFSGAD